MLIVQGFPPLGGVKQWWGGETSYFVAKCVNISKTVGDTPKVNKLQFMTNKKLHYALSIDTKIDDLG